MRAILIGAALLASAGMASAAGHGGGGHGGGGRGAGMHHGGGSGSFDGGFVQGFGFREPGRAFRGDRYGRSRYPLYGYGYDYPFGYGYGDAGYGDGPGPIGSGQPYGPGFGRPGSRDDRPGGLVGLYNHSGQGAYAYGYNGYAETPELPVVFAYGGYAEGPAAYRTPAAYTYASPPTPVCGC